MNKETGMKYLRAVFLSMVLFSVATLFVLAWMEGVILGALATLAVGLWGLLFIYDSGHKK